MSFRHATFVLFFALSVSGFATAQTTSPDGVWSDREEAAIAATANREIIPDRYRTVSVDLAGLRRMLDIAPMEFTEDAFLRTEVLDMPLPYGGFSRFRIQESPIMEPELAAKFPEIRTFTGIALDDHAFSVRFDLTPAGFHAMIFTPHGTVYIDPYSRGTITEYISYYKRDYPWTPDKAFSCEGPIDETGEGERINRLIQSTNLEYSGTHLRTYRAAVAATGEYTVYHGGTVAAGMAAIVTAMNRVNGIYERDVAVRMVLVANNDLVVYTNGGTDPYSNNNGSAMLTQNINTLNSVIGSANYDIGHVFSTGGGGVAYLGVVCTSNKGGGVTGLGAPIGDPFYVDYVAHEIGHQFGANHTFNGNAGSCSGNRSASNAYEPGSGTTIMAYAGICGSQNIQSNSDDHFHINSIVAIVTFTTSGSGNSCPVTTSTGNSVPVVSVPSGGFTIPVNTPFELTGSATDANGDALTYCWEQYNLGAAGHPNTPSGDAPIFRSFTPSTSPTRSFPKLSDILNNTQTIGEILPSYTRNLTFRLTVRDNRSNGGGVAYGSVAFSANSSAGPFVVTSPNTAVSWAGNSNQTVTWNVANTNASPVNVSHVNIRLSTNGGNTFPITLVANTPNDGSEIVTMPNIATTQARVRVEAVGNVFFDLSNTNFTITFSTLAAPLLVSPADNVTQQPVALPLVWRTVASATAYRLQVGTDSTFTGGMIVNDSTLTDTTYALSGLSVNTKYFWRVQGKNASITGAWSSVRRFTTIAPPAAITLVSPANNATEQQPDLNLVWNAATGAATYRLQLGTDSTFGGGIVVDDSTLTDTSYAASGLLTSTTYFWRVSGSNAAGSGAWSSVRKFATVTPPGAVTLLTPSNNSTGLLQNIILLWAQTPGATKYEVQLGTDSTFTGVLVVDDSTTTDTSYAVTGLSFNQEYFWRVRASNIAGNGGWMSSKFLTLAPPSPASLLYPGDEATGLGISLLLIWEEAPTADAYRVQLATDSTFSGGIVADDSLLTDTIRAVAGLDPGTTYFWRVEASNEAGSSGWGTMNRFTTASLPGVITLVTPGDDEEISSNSVLLSWSDGVPPADTYWLELSTDSLFAVSMIDSSLTDTTTTLNGLADSTVYYWRVRGGNPAGWGPYSDVRTFATLFKVTVCMTINEGWSIVSLPVGTTEDSVHAIFPDCGPQPAYAFVPGSGYQERWTLEPGIGYWVKCTSGNPCAFGTPIASKSIPVVEGWNLIGSITTSIPVTSVTTVPPGILDSPFYSFDQGYIQSSMIEAGGAYWVKVSANGVIELDGTVIIARPTRGNEKR